MPSVLVGYLPTYRIAAVRPEVARHLTDVVFFSLEPSPVGEIVGRERITPEALRLLKEMKTRHRVRVLVTVGGWGRSDGFPALAADPKARQAFVAALLALCREHGFGGVDYDWEHPKGPDEEANYGRLIAETRAAFAPQKLLVTAALAPWQNLSPLALTALDRIHLMSYDNNGEHSTFAQATADVEGMLKKGASAAKLCLGVPFYGRSVKDRNDALAWADIASRFHPAPESDTAGDYYFNGPVTLQRKARYVRERGLAGVMIWEIGQDAPGKDALLPGLAKQVRRP